MRRRFIHAVLLLCLLAGACRQDSPAPEPEPAKKISQTTEIDPATGAPKRLPNPWRNAGCDLVTDHELMTLFAIDPIRDEYAARPLPNKGFCLRTWMKPNFKEIEQANELPGAVFKEFKNTLVTQVLDYGTPLVAQEQYNMLRRDRRDAFEEDVPGLGEGALWSTSTTTLMVKSDHLILNITLDHTENLHDNLEKAKEVAKLALQKMQPAPTPK